MKPRRRTCPDLLTPPELRVREEARRAWIVAPHGQRRRRFLRLRAATTAALRARA